MNTAITNKQRREISHLEYVFISRQVRGNCLLIHGELYQRALKQDELKQRPSSLLSYNRRPKHSLWLNKIYIWNSKTNIVNRSTQQRYRKFYRQNKSLSTAVQLSRPGWTDSITCVRMLDNIVWSDASRDIWNSPLYIHQNHRQCSVLDVYHVDPWNLKHILKLHVQYLPKYSYTRYIHPLLARTRSPKYY